METNASPKLSPIFADILSAPLVEPKQEKPETIDPVMARVLELWPYIQKKATQTYYQMQARYGQTPHDIDEITARFALRAMELGREDLTQLDPIPHPSDPDNVTRANWRRVQKLAWKYHDTHGRTAVRRANDYWGISLDAETNDGETDLAAIVGTDAERQTWNLLASSDLKNALRQLTPMQRDVFLRNKLLGVTLREIAEDDGMKEGTVRSHLARAKKSLQAQLPNYSQTRGQGPRQYHPDVQTIADIYAHTDKDPDLDPWTDPIPLTMEWVLIANRRIRRIRPMQNGTYAVECYRVGQAHNDILINIPGTTPIAIVDHRASRLTETERGNPGLDRYWTETGIYAPIKTRDILPPLEDDGQRVSPIPPIWTGEPACYLQYKGKGHPKATENTQTPARAIVYQTHSLTTGKRMVEDAPTKRDETAETIKSLINLYELDPLAYSPISEIGNTPNATPAYLTIPTLDNLMRKPTAQSLPARVEYNASELDYLTL